MKNIALKLKFAGTSYHGWQLQKEHRTVAGTLNAALSELCGYPVKASGCGRTDAGVHAEVFCANFKSNCSVPPDRLPYALNPLLPKDIAVQKAMYVNKDFNANRSCVKKEYTYRIICGKLRDPFYADRAFFYPRALNMDEMKKAARHLEGTHDFAAFRSTGSKTKTTTRTVFWYKIQQSDKVVELRACADGFLYNMARAMAGTLVFVSEGKLSPDDIPTLIENKSRHNAGPTLPPDGLYLTKLWYEGEIGKMLSEQ